MRQVLPVLPSRRPEQPERLPGLPPVYLEGLDRGKLMGVSLRLKDFLGPVTRVKKKRKGVRGVGREEVSGLRG